MKRLTGSRESSQLLMLHHHVCDLVFSDAPLFSLFTDGKSNWLYLWCDTNGSRHRWLVFRVDRSMLVLYLERKATALELVNGASRLYAMDEGSIEYVDMQSGKKSKRTIRRTTLDEMNEYLPSEDSYFEEELSVGLDLTQQLVPSSYKLPIDGQWFGRDFEQLFKRYERVYAFFYATRRQFVTNIGSSLGGCLSPI